jgi:hypothetical protein
MQEGKASPISLYHLESPTTPGAGGLYFFPTGRKIQRRGSALIGAGVTGCSAPGLKTPNRYQPTGHQFPKKMLSFGTFFKNL